MPSCIRVEPIGDSASLITLDRPAKRNALSIALRDETHQCCSSGRAGPARNY